MIWVPSKKGCYATNTAALPFVFRASRPNSPVLCGPSGGGHCITFYFFLFSPFLAHYFNIPPRGTTSEVVPQTGITSTPQQLPLFREFHSQETALVRCGPPPPAFLNLPPNQHMLTYTHTYTHEHAHTNTQIHSMTPNISDEEHNGLCL